MVTVKTWKKVVGQTVLELRIASEFNKQQRYFYIFLLPHQQLRLFFFSQWGITTASVMFPYEACILEKLVYLFLIKFPPGHQ